MKMIVARDELAGALAIAGKVAPWCPPRSTPTSTPQGMIRVELAEGGGLIRSANFERSISVSFPADGEPMALTLPLVTLENWVGKVAAGARIEIQPTDAGALLLGGRSRVNIPKCTFALPPERTAAGASLKVAASALRAGLEAVVSVPKEDVSQPVLGGVMLHGTADALGFVATDSNRVHEMISAASDDVRAILPNDTARLLLAILPNDTAPVTITLDERNINFAVGDIRICSALMDGKYPITADQFERPMPNTLRARADTLLADLELVATVADPRNRDIVLSLGEACIASADSSSSTTARGEVRLLARWEGAPLDITFALRPLRDALTLFGADEIEWDMAGPLDGTVMTSTSRPDLRALVSPFLPKLQQERIAA